MLSPLDKGKDKLTTQDLWIKMFLFYAADLKVTQRSFNFGKKQGLPFYFVSAADGTNVVKV